VTADPDAVRRRLLELAREDPAVRAAATTGSRATGDEDEWSDVDLAIGVVDAVPEALARWTALLAHELGLLHHWDLPWGSSVHRVFLTADGLEVDLAVTPADDFGPRGPSWRTEFGPTVEARPAAPQRLDDLAGHAWHHVLHANAAIERGRPWQAEHWVNAARDAVLALACLRHGRSTWYAREVHLLPAEELAPLEASLVRSLDERELHRALAAVTRAVTAELERADPALAERLRPVLADLAVRQDEALGERR
jgi:predicted nucleotidyltransferase